MKPSYPVLLVLVTVSLLGSVIAMAATTSNSSSDLQDAFSSGSTSYLDFPQTKFSVKVGGMNLQLRASDGTEVKIDNHLARHGVRRSTGAVVEWFISPATQELGDEYVFIVGPTAYSVIYKGGTKEITGPNGLSIAISNLAADSAR